MIAIMLSSSGGQHVIRKALGSYGEALYLAVYLSFANKSQVTSYVLNFPIITATTLSDIFCGILCNILRHYEMRLLYGIRLSAGLVLSAVVSVAILALLVSGFSLLCTVKTLIILSYTYLCYIHCAFAVGLGTVC